MSLKFNATNERFIQRIKIPKGKINPTSTDLIGSSQILWRASMIVGIGFVLAHAFWRKKTDLKRKQVSTNKRMNIPIPYSVSVSVRTPKISKPLILNEFILDIGELDSLDEYDINICGSDFEFNKSLRIPSLNSKNEPNKAKLRWNVGKFKQFVSENPIEDALKRIDALKRAIIKNTGKCGYKNLIKRHEYKIDNKILNRITENKDIQKTRYLSTVVHATKICTESNDKLRYQIKLNAKYDDEMRNKYIFIKKVKQELAKALDLNIKLLDIGDITKGSIKMRIIVPSILFLIAIGFDVYAPAPVPAIGSWTQNVDFELSGNIWRYYKRRWYECTVTAIISTAIMQSITTHFKNDPFYWGNYETTKLDKKVKWLRPAIGPNRIEFYGHQ